MESATVTIATLVVALGLAERVSLPPFRLLAMSRMGRRPTCAKFFLRPPQAEKNLQSLILTGDGGTMPASSTRKPPHRRGQWSGPGALPLRRGLPSPVDKLPSPW